MRPPATLTTVTTAMGASEEPRTRARTSGLDSRRITNHDQKAASASESAVRPKGVAVPIPRASGPSSTSVITAAAAMAICAFGATAGRFARANVSRSASPSRRRCSSRPRWVTASIQLPPIHTRPAPPCRRENAVMPTCNAVTSRRASGRSTDCRNERTDASRKNRNQARGRRPPARRSPRRRSVAARLEAGDGLVGWLTCRPPSVHLCCSSLVPGRAVRLERSSSGRLRGTTGSLPTGHLGGSDRRIRSPMPLRGSFSTAYSPRAQMLSWSSMASRARGHDPVRRCVSAEVRSAGSCGTAGRRPPRWGRPCPADHPVWAAPPRAFSRPRAWGC